MTNPNQSCPKCGAPIGDDAPRGLCPKCVLSGAATTAPHSNTAAAGRSAPPTIEEVAPHFPDLEILELIGAGGMGSVFKARQKNLDRIVALKILSRDLSEDPAFAERFNREGRVLARLSHPNIVTVFDTGAAGPFAFLTMEFVDGVNLRQALAAGSFTSTESLNLVQEICSALKFAHEEGILHRDIKPENILIDARGQVKIADFGIAKLVGQEQPDYTLTLEGSILGSPQYMAPEQIETPGDVDQRADIYSLGVVLYEMLTGELPLGRFALPSEKGAIDARIDDIVLRTLAKEREARFQTAGEVKSKVEVITNSAAADISAPASKSKTKAIAIWTAVTVGVCLLALPLVSLVLPQILGKRSEVSTNVSLPSEVDDLNPDWLQGEPEIELEFVAPANRVSVFALQSPWDPEYQFPDDWYIVTNENENFRGVIQIGIVGLPEIDGQIYTDVVAVLKDAAGNPTKSQRIRVKGEQQVSLPPFYHLVDMENPLDGEMKGMKMGDMSGPLDLAEEGIHFVIYSAATDSEMDDGLRVIAWSVPRPDQSEPAPAAARVGPNNPPNVIDSWIQHRQKQLMDRKASAPEADAVAMVDEVQGDIRARFGFMFDTQERVVGDKFTLREQEALLIKKGSQAKMFLDEQNFVQLGPQQEDGHLVIQFSEMWILTPGSALKAQFKYDPNKTPEIMAGGHGALLKPSGNAAFQISSDNHLEVLEGEVGVAPHPGAEANQVKAGQKINLGAPH